MNGLRIYIESPFILAGNVLQNEFILARSLYWQVDHTSNEFTLAMCFVYTQNWFILMCSLQQQGFYTINEFTLSNSLHYQ